MVIASQYELIPYVADLLPVSNGHSDFLPERQNTFQGKSNQYPMQEEPIIHRIITQEKSHSIYTEDSNLSSIGMPEIGLLIDVYV